MSLKEVRKISCARIKLVEIQPKYFPNVLCWRNNPENSQYFFSKSKLDVNTQRQWYKRYRQDSTDFTFIILLRSNIPIGMLSLYHINNFKKTAEFGRLLIGETKYRRQGYAFEACLACLSVAFCMMELDEVYLEVYKSNHRAIRIYERLGFSMDLRKRIPAQDALVMRMRLRRSTFMRKDSASAIQHWY